MAITCCKDCVAPKRHPGCNDRCEEYKAEKAQHDVDRERQKEWLNSGLYAQKVDGIARATRKRGGKIGGSRF